VNSARALEESKGIEPLSLTASRFQIGVLVHAGRFPFSQLLELEIPFGVEPRTSSFAAKTHAVWLEIIWGKGRDSNPHKGTVALRKLASCGKLQTHSRTLRTRVASQCIRNLRRFLTCAIPVRFAGDQVFRCAYPFALPNPCLCC
jgi:hypothetical protein